MRLIFSSIILLLMSSNPTLAEEKKDSRSVYEINPWIDGGIIAGSVLGVSYAYSHPSVLISKNCPCDPSTVNPFDRGAIFNDRPSYYSFASGTVYATIAIPVILDAIDLGMKKELSEDVVVFAEVLAVNQALTTLLKFSIQRPFPHRYLSTNTNPVEAGDFIAFPSGHTSTVAALLSATAVTINLRYGKDYWSWVAAGLVTTIVGYSMVHSGEHFNSDVLAGAALGAVVGISIPLMHKRSPNSDEGTHLGILPINHGFGLLARINY